MKKLMNILFLSCLKATELIEKQFHIKLSMKERLQLKIHKTMCSACTNYEKQSLTLEKGIAKNAHIIPSTVDVEQLKKSINDKLSNHK